MLAAVSPTFLLVRAGGRTGVGGRTILSITYAALPALGVGRLQPERRSPEAMLHLLRTCPTPRHGSVVSGLTYFLAGKGQHVVLASSVSVQTSFA